MNISYNWLKDYLNIDMPVEQISEILTDIGLEVEGLELVESVKGGLEGLIIGEVTFQGKHENSDHLSVTRVNIGGEEELHIVCGAPNVAQGQKVVVATVGTTLYTAEGESFKIKKGKIRGEVSQGMICAEDEIGLGASHDGIMVLPADVAAGTLAKDYFNIENDYVIEIGLTPNRSDATSHIGVARDLAAALSINYDYKGGVKMPDLSNFKVEHKDLTLEVSVENTAACPRYSGVSIQGVEIKESPDWLKTRLAAIGVRPISNIVDITNFVLHEYGQPLHAFDIDKIADGKIIVKNLPEGEKFLSLDEVERKLSAEDLMICDGKSKGMCIGGVFGGLNSGVTDHSKNIFLEAAHFHAKTIRRTSTRHDLRTDAAKVFEKGSDPNVTVNALKRAALLIQELAGGVIASEIVDIYPTVIEKRQIEVSYTNVNNLIGVDIPTEQVKAILASMHIDILSDDGDKFTVAIPTDKADVTREADVIEEILRIYGFNNIPIRSELKSSLSYWSQLDPHQSRNVVGNFLAANGFNEMMGLSISQSKYYKELLPLEESKLVYINNTSNIHLDVMRPTMLFAGLEAILHNQNRKNADLRFYEYGRSYRKEGEAFKEREHFTLFMTGKRHAESWLTNDKDQVDFFTLKAYVNNLLSRLGFSGYQMSAIEGDDVLAFGTLYHRGPQDLVRFGKVKGSIQKGMDIKKAVFYADFNWDNILKALKKQKVEFSPLNKFPSMRRDLALVVNKSTLFDQVSKIARKTAKSLLQDVNLFDIYEDKERLGADKKSYAVSFVFEDSSKTLKDKDVDKVMGKLIANYERELGALIRK